MPQGQPLTVPDDGLTTRQRRNRPLLVVHTGPGKGKSTAAFGLVYIGKDYIRYLEDPDSIAAIVVSTPLQLCTFQTHLW